MIGTEARYVTRNGGAGPCRRAICIVNDVSEREFQMARRSGTRARASIPFGPLGPWLVTADEIRDPQALDMSLDVNGTRMQSGNTRTMIFGVATIVCT